jgi:tRNA(fMet)-specific endonuclease VapC
MIVADTDVLIDYLAGQGAADRVELELERRALATTSVSRFELLSGARTERQREVVQDLMDGMPALPLDAAAADEAATVRRELEARGEGIGMADSLIAGIVRLHQGVLLTRNRRHFERVDGLQLAELDATGCSG